MTLINRQQEKQMLEQSCLDALVILGELMGCYDTDFATVSNALFRLMRDEANQPELQSHIVGRMDFMRASLWEVNRRLTDYVAAVGCALPPLRLPPPPTVGGVETLARRLEQLEQCRETLDRNINLALQWKGKS